MRSPSTSSCATATTRARMRHDVRNAASSSPPRSLRASALRSSTLYCARRARAASALPQRAAVARTASAAPGLSAPMPGFLRRTSARFAGLSSTKSAWRDDRCMASSVARTRSPLRPSPKSQKTTRSRRPSALSRASAAPRSAREHTVDTTPRSASVPMARTSASLASTARPPRPSSPPSSPKVPRQSVSSRSHKTTLTVAGGGAVDGGRGARSGSRAADPSVDQQTSVRRSPRVTRRTRCSCLRASKTQKEPRGGRSGTDASPTSNSPPP